MKTLEGYNGVEFYCFKCKNCSLVYASPQPIINEQSLNEIYSSDYYESYFGTRVSSFSYLAFSFVF